LQRIRHRQFLRISFQRGLLHSLTLLKPLIKSIRFYMPFGRYTCRVRWLIVLHRGLWPPGEGETPSQPKRAITNCNQTVSGMLPPGEYKRGVGGLASAIPPVAKSLRSLCCISRNSCLKTLSQRKVLVLLLDDRCRHDTIAHIMQ